MLKMAQVVNSAKQAFPIVYHSLQQVLKTLTACEVGNTSEVRELLKIGVNRGILDGNSNSRLQILTTGAGSRRNNLPFICVEGLDGTGKSHVSKALSSRLNLELRGTPPEYIKHLKGFFNEQREPVKRAYFSFGNYLAAFEITNSDLNKGNVIDRYWPSTSAYAIAHELTTNLRSSVTPTDFHWPCDLVRPDIVLFLVVSEEIRVARHAKRGTTNTKEEKMLANNSIFRENLIASYTQIQGPKVVTLKVDEDIDIVKTNICEQMTQMYPVLLENSKLKSDTDPKAAGNINANPNLVEDKFYLN